MLENFVKKVLVAVVGQIPNREEMEKRMDMGGSKEIK